MRNFVRFRLPVLCMLLLVALQIKAAKEIYGVVSNDGSSMTIYYDENKSSHTVVEDIGGYNYYTDVITVTFDKSVAEARPFSTHSWFSGCSKLTTINGLEYLNTSEVTTMTGMFQNCASLTKLDLRSFDTSKATDMEGLFAYCSALESVDLSSFNTSSVVNMAGMFAECSSLKTIYADESRWSTASLNDYGSSDLFYNCGPLVGGNGTSYYDKLVEDASYARVDKAGQPGYFTQKDGPAIAQAEPYAVYDNGTLTFYYDTNKSSHGGEAIEETGTPVSQNYKSTLTEVVFDASFAKYTTLTSTASWFSECGSLKTIKGIENLKTSNVTTMLWMFARCSSLTSLDVSHFDTQNVTNMGCMFLDCSSLTTLDLSNFNTAKVTEAYSMFDGCSSLTTLNVSNLNTSSMIDMTQMFYDCSSLTSLDVSHFDTQNVTNMHCMFMDCSSLKSLNVSNFNTKSVENMVQMFQGCSSLTSLDVSKFDMGKATDIRNMFYGCSNLTTIYCDNNWSNITQSGDMFRDCEKLNGYSYSKITSAYAKPIADGGYFSPAAEAGGGGGGEVTTKKCATPTISLNNGKLVFGCETEGAVCNYTVSSAEGQVSPGTEVSPFTSYKVTVYASKDGYDNSDTVSEEIEVPTSKKGDVNGDGVVDAADIVTVVNIIMAGGSEGGTTGGGKAPAGVEAVDLGLPSGRLWASMNVGASKPEDYGDYFAWGETTPQSDNAYSWTSYKWCNGSSNTMTKYCSKSEYGNNGFTDNKTVLDMEDDAARANWGGDWRMPTEAEFGELIVKTKHEWTTQNGVNGYKFTSKTNGNSIFLPASGRWVDELTDVGSYGYYWSSSLYEYTPYYASSAIFSSGSLYQSFPSRRIGQPVRPVR